MDIQELIAIMASIIYAADYRREGGDHDRKLAMEDAVETAREIGLLTSESRKRKP